MQECWVESRSQPSAHRHCGHVTTRGLYVANANVVGPRPAGARHAIHVLPGEPVRCTHVRGRGGVAPFDWHGGGSAGGYTTLAALAFHDTFRAGASYYGISDLEVLARDTHKFESRYMDRLVGPYPAMQATYRKRSPIHAVDRFNCALILLQGLDDNVVPPDQSEMMAAAVRKKGLPVAYVTFEASSTASARPRTSCARSRPNSTFTARCSGSRRPTRWRPWRSTTFLAASREDLAARTSA